jgi:hypothetical protein
MFCFRQKHGGKTNRMTDIFNYNLHLERNLGRIKKEIAKEERTWKQEGRIVRNKEFQKSVYTIEAFSS